MSTIIAIASISIKAINTYFTCKEEEQLRYIAKQNEDMLELQKDMVALQRFQYNQSKLSILNRAKQEMHDGLVCSDPILRKDTLMAAYQDYTLLCNLPMKEQLPDGTQVDNENLLCKGYWGRFIYFGLMNDFRNSAIQVYECALKCPYKAVQMFDSSFFPEVDCSKLSELCENLDRINNYKPLIGLYSNMPKNMAEPLIDMQLKKYKERFTQILKSLKTEQL